MEARKIKLNTVKSAIDNCLTRYQQVLANKERWAEQLLIIKYFHCIIIKFIYFRYL